MRWLILKGVTGWLLSMWVSTAITFAQFVSGRDGTEARSNALDLAPTGIYDTTAGPALRNTWRNHRRLQPVVGRARRYHLAAGFPGAACASGGCRRRRRLTLMRTNQALRLPAAAKFSFLLVLVAAGMRVLPDLGVSLSLPGGHHAASAMAWALAFLVWLYGYWPLLRDPRTLGRSSC